MTEPLHKPLSLPELVSKGLLHGTMRVMSAGSPLQPLLFDDSGKMLILLDKEGGKDPMELACAAIKSHIPTTKRCALVIDSRITFVDGKKWDAIVVMACERGNDEGGEVWAQRYVPKSIFRKFRVEGDPEKVAKSRDFISISTDEA